MALWIFIKENLTPENIVFFLFYVSNAVSVSTDIFIALVWFGITTKIAFLLSSLVILGWLLLYLSSHNEKKRENLDENKMEHEAIKEFINNQLDVWYLHRSQLRKIGADHFKFLFSLTVFHYFKKSFADSIHRAILNKEKFESHILETKFKEIVVKLSKIKISDLIEQTYFCHKEFTDVEKESHANKIYNKIGWFIDLFKKELELGKDKKIYNNINSYLDLIDKLDAFSIEKRNNIITAISCKNEAVSWFSIREKALQALSPQDKETTLMLLLKIEHTYTLKNQRKSLMFIWVFSIINALSNGVIMLTSGFAKVGLSAIKLLLFSLSGICCSYILTSPKIYNIVKSIIGYFENYCRSDNKAAQTQKTSFIFKTSLLMSFITALASGLFAFYVLHNYLITLHSHTLITAALYSSYFMSFITFCGAFCLYFDSIFAILSNNKKDIFSPHDSLNKILKVPFSKEDLYIFAMLTISCALIYISSLNSSYLNLGVLITLLASLTMLSPITKSQITSFAATLIALSITATAIHQICIISALPINMATIAILATFSLIQSATLACTFYKGIDKLIHEIEKTSEKITRAQAPATIHSENSRRSVIVSVTPKEPDRHKKIDKEPTALARVRAEELAIQIQNT